MKSKFITTNFDEFLNEKNSDDTFTHEFWRWFGDSKIVDRIGKPLIVYHGSDNNFDTVDVSISNESDDSYYGKGFYATTNKSYARSYGSNLYELYIKSENPLNMSELKTNDVYDLTDFFISSLPEKITSDSIPYFYEHIKKSPSKATGKLFNLSFDEYGNVTDINALKELLTDLISNVDSFKYGYLQDFSDALTKYAHQNNYDSIISDSGFSEIVVFNSNQIKSVNNDGSFDVDDDNINS